MGMKSPLFTNTGAGIMPAFDVVQRGLFLLRRRKFGAELRALLRDKFRAREEKILPTVEIADLVPPDVHVSLLEAETVDGNVSLEELSAIASLVEIGRAHV